MSLPITSVEMRFRPPAKEPEIAVDSEGRVILADWSVPPYGEVLSVHFYSRNSDGTVDVRAAYDQLYLREAMERMGYDVVPIRLSGIEGSEGVVGFSHPDYRGMGRTLKQFNRELSQQGQ